MKHFLIIPLIVIFSLTVYSQKVKQIDKLLLNDCRQTEVLLLGVFHFEYYNFDSHKTDSENQMDILLPNRQKEILQIVKQIAKFNPAIICIEEKNDSLSNLRYRSYLNDEYKLSKNETDQLGFRIAQRTNLKKVFAVDDQSWFRDNLKNDATLEQLWDEQYYLDTVEMNNWSEKYSRFYKYQDSVSAKLSIKNYLKLLNHPIVLGYNLGQYLVEMKTSNHNGPDFVTLDWYNRNLRIFNNILQTNPSGADRVLVIYGSGHIPLLQHFFESSPQFKVIPISKYLR